MGSPWPVGLTGARDRQVLVATVWSNFCTSRPRPPACVSSEWSGMAGSQAPG